MILNEYIEALELNFDISKEDATARFTRAAEELARELFGRSREYEASLTNPYGEIELIVFYDVVAAEEVEDPSRQLALEACSPLFDDVKPGDELGFALGINHRGRKQAEENEERYQMLGVAPLQHQGFERALERTLSDVYYEITGERPSLEPHTVGALLEQGGGWLLGLTGTSQSGETKLTIEATTFDPKLASVSSHWLDYSIELALEQGGEVRSVVFEGSDHFGNVVSGFELPAARLAKESEVVALLSEFAETYETSTSTVNTYQFVNRVLAAAQQQPEEGSLFYWLRDTFIAHVKAQGPITVKFHGLTLTFEPKECFLSSDSFSAFKRGSVSALAVWKNSADEVLDIREQELWLGACTHKSFTLPAPMPEQAEVLLGWAARAHAIIAQDLRYMLERYQPLEDEDGNIEVPYIFGWFPENAIDVLKLSEKAMEHGLPPKPPIPHPSPEHFESHPLQRPTEEDMARVERRFRGCTSQPIATYRIDHYLIVLRDDVKRRPFGCSEITLLRDNEDEDTQILLTDVWNPYTRWSVDGDAFAFRRFMQWLGGQIEHHGLDQTIAFLTDPDEYADEYEDEDVEAPTLLVTEWLHQGLLERGDEFLLDWRFQNYIVGAGHPMTNAAGMFGFRAAYIKQLAERDRARWREFLASCLHPSFAEGYAHDQ